MNDDTNQRARECLANAAEQFGCKEVPAALRGGDIALINSDIAISAITSASEEALREVAEKIDALERLWTRVSDQLDYIPDGMHAGLEDAASDMANAFDALITGDGERG